MLEPCAGCARHVLATETACPFCGAERSPTTPGPAASSVLGRLSRAAVFAGAATLGAACYTNPPPPNYQQQPPPPPPYDPNQGNGDQGYAQPPDGASMIFGTLTDGSGVPLAGHTIELQPINSGAGPQHAVTDAQGRYAFRVPPGEYMVSTAPANPREMPIQQVVRLAEGASAAANLVLYRSAPVYDRSNIPKPYGAPPARRRVV